jgi:hypothetical protein
MVNGPSPGPALFTEAGDRRLAPSDVHSHSPRPVPPPFYVAVQARRTGDGVTWGVRSVRGIAFLEDAVRWRQQCILVLTWAKPQEPLYRAMEGVLGAIDGLAEVVSRWQAAVPPAEPALARAGSSAREVEDRRLSLGFDPPGSARRPIRSQAGEGGRRFHRRPSEMTGRR